MKQLALSALFLVLLTACEKHPIAAIDITPMKHGTWRLGDTLTVRDVSLNASSSYMMVFDSLVDASEFKIVLDSNNITIKCFAISKSGNKIDSLTFTNSVYTGPI